MRSDWNLTWLGGVAAIVLIFAAAIAAASPATMLEEGIYAEQTKGDLNEAIQIYRRIIADDAANRRHVSEALYRLGSCRLKQGDQQAAADAYGRLAGLYPERSDLIEQAESQMAAFYREHPDAAAPAHPVTLPDPASLMPADTLAYVEIGSPGMQVETLLKLLAGTPLANPLAVMRSAPASIASPMVGMFRVATSAWRYRPSSIRLAAPIASWGNAVFSSPITASDWL